MQIKFLCEIITSGSHKCHIIVPQIIAARISWLKVVVATAANHSFTVLAERMLYNVLLVTSATGEL